MVGLYFSKNDANTYLKDGGILREKVWLMQLVSELIQVIPIKHPLDKTQKQAGQGYRGYATFVKMMPKAIHLK